MEKEYRHIIFDLDGTISDPKIGIINSVKYAIEKMNLKSLSDQELETFIGPPLGASFKEYFKLDDEGIAKAVAFFREYFSEKGIFENTLYPYIPQLLLEIANQGKQAYIATSKPTHFAKQIVEHFKINIYFADVEGSMMNTPDEEKSAVLNRLIERNPEITSENAVMIGDRKYDIKAAQEHQIDTIGAVYGYGEKDELEDAGAFFFAKNIDEISSIIL